MTPPTIRFGYTDSIHLLPLLYPLIAGWVYPSGQKIELLPMPAPDLETALREGSLDGGMLDPVAYARLRPMLEVMPGIGLASEGANGMAVLQSRTRPDLLDGATVACEPHAAGGIAQVLLKVLAEPFFGVSLNLLPEDGTPEDRLLSGDAAVRARLPWLLYEAHFSHSALDDARAGLRPVPTAAPGPAVHGYAEDLGAAWWVLTGTPMVWALGVLRRELLDRPGTVVSLVRAFQQSRVSAHEQAPTVLAAASARVGVPEAALRAVYERQSVELDPRAQGGLAAFYRRIKSA